MKTPTSPLSRVNSPRTRPTPTSVSATVSRTVMSSQFGNTMLRTNSPYTGIGLFSAALLSVSRTQPYLDHFWKPKYSHYRSVSSPTTTSQTMSSVLMLFLELLMTVWFSQDHKSVLQSNAFRPSFGRFRCRDAGTARTKNETIIITTTNCETRCSLTGGSPAQGSSCPCEKSRSV
jgi:hypothetical protein